ncbi:MAG: hypothetical protein R3342_10640 [Lutibacter sp.]|uniref:hypothetical protein n=1 Tax=Lutibacter sp. TaxID=1925666 RepID=UPI00299D9232|nr:hypothetical protein [Lutibacter sp.]MDX1829990.1 hypothetical protein [Lutibacter sp.]
MKNIIIIITIFFTTFSFSQSKLNNYKYILVPNQFEFQRSPDIHQINSLTKFLFNKAGFTVFLTNESYPNDLAENRCKALTTRIINNPNIFSTRVTIELLDCNNNIVFTTRQGKSKLKDYRKAYNEAIRAAFRDIENVNYQYKPIPKPEIREKTKENKVVSKTVIKDVTLPKSVVKKEKRVPKKIVVAEVSNKNIVGKYQIGDYGICTIVKDNHNFKILSGDENFEIAKAYKTSQPNIFIVKWVAYKQPQLMQLTKQGNIKIDTVKGVKEYNRKN